MTTTLTEKDSIRLLSDAYIHGYPNLLEKLGIELIGKYQVTKDTVKRPLPEVFTGKSMSDFASMWRPDSRSFSFSLEASILKAAINGNVDLRAVKSMFLPVDSAYKNTPIRGLPKPAPLNKDYANLIFASSYATKEEGISEWMDPDVEEAIELFKITRALGVDDTGRLGITYIVARFGFTHSSPGDRSAVFFTENEAVEFLAKQILDHEPRFAYKNCSIREIDFYADFYSEEPQSSLIDYGEGEKRTSREIFDYFNGGFQESPFYKDRVREGRVVPLAEIKTFSL